MGKLEDLLEMISFVISCFIYVTELIVPIAEYTNSIMSSILVGSLCLVALHYTILYILRLPIRNGRKSNRKHRRNRSDEPKPDNWYKMIEVLKR